MAIEQTVSELVLSVGEIGLWMQTLGFLVVLWLVFSLITLFFNRRRRKILYKIDQRLERVEKKLDKLSKKK